VSGTWTENAQKTVTGDYLFGQEMSVALQDHQLMVCRVDNLGCQEKRCKV